MVPSAMAAAVTDPAASLDAVTAPFRMAGIVTELVASCALVTAPFARFWVSTAPGASLLLVSAWSGRFAAIIAYPTDPRRWSGDNWTKPFVLSPSQIRKKVSALVNSVQGIGCMLLTVASPRLIENNP